MYYGTLLANAIPTVPLDKGVRQAVTGNLLMDLLPLITMAPCIPTLVLFWRKQRLNDFLLFGVGFSLAIAYHVAHIDGIEQSTLLGLPGAVWRSLDIFVAQSLLSRTLGHAIGAHTSFVATLCNAVYPTVLIAWSYLSKHPAAAIGLPPLTLGSASRMLLFIMLAALAAKFAVEGPQTMPTYCPKRGKTSLLCFFLAFVVFPLPEIFPRLYWLSHSLWHCLIGAGYYILYSELLDEQRQSKAKKLPRRPRVMLHATAAEGGSDRAKAA